VSPRAVRSALTPWAGVFLGAAAWFIHQQAGSGGDYWDCHLTGPFWSIGVGIVCGAIAVIGGVISWGSRRSAGEDRSETRRFSGIVGAASAGIFLMAILFQILASLIVPACAR
jgi:uncharacterized membrane protein